MIDLSGLRVSLNADLLVSVRTGISDSATVLECDPPSALPIGTPWPRLAFENGDSSSARISTNAREWSTLLPTQARLALPGEVSSVGVLPLDDAAVIAVWGSSARPSDALSTLEQARQVMSAVSQADAAIYRADLAFTMLTGVLDGLEKAVLAFDPVADRCLVNTTASSWLGVEAGFIPITEASAAMLAFRSRALNSAALATSAVELLIDPLAHLENWIWEFEGDRSHIEVQTYPLPGADSGARVWIFEDVTARLAAEQSERELMAARARFEQAMTGTEVAMVITLPDGTFERVNDAMCTMLDRDRAELMTKTWPEFTHPDDIGEDWTYVREILAGTREYFRRTKRYLRSDGSLVHAYLTVSALRNADGDVERLLAQIIDLSAEVEAKEQRESALAAETQVRELLEITLNSLMDGVVHATAIRDERGAIIDYRIDSANEEVARFMRLPLDTLIGARLFEVAPGVLDSPLMPFWHAVIETGETLDERGIHLNTVLRPGARRFDVRGTKVGDGLVYSFREVTHEYEQAMRVARSELELRALSDGMIDPQILLDPIRDDHDRILDLRIVSVNPAAAAYLGVAIDDVVGKGMQEVFPGTADTGLFALYLSSLSTGDPVILDDFEYENELLGEKLVYEVRASRVGERLSATWRDVTATRAAQSELLRSEALLRAILDSVPDVYALFAPVRDESGSIIDFEYLDVNEACCAMTGVSREAHVGLLASQIFPDYRHTELFAAEVRTLETGEPLVLDDFMYHDLYGPGSHAYFSVRAARVGDLLSVLVRDVTKQQQMSAQVIERERQYRLLAENSTDIVVLSIGGVYQWVSPSVTEVLGWLPSQIVGTRQEDYVHPDDISTMVAARAAGAVGEQARVRVRFRASDDVYHWIEVSAGPATNELGEVAGVVASIRVVDEAVAIDMQLRDALEAATVATRLKSEFVANMSHEIRTPLTAVLGLLTLLGDSGLDDRQESYVERAELAAKSLLDVLNGILDYSKIEAGAFDLEVAEFSLDELFREVGVVMAATAADKSLELVFDLDPRLPAVLVGDEFRLRQVLLNLAGNAVKFTEQGYVEIAASLVTADSREVTIDVAVRDTGIGMSADMLERIFTSFVQAESSISRRFGGTGLGLALCEGLLELMGTQLEVRSAPGQGSEFFFRLTLPSQSSTLTLADSLSPFADERVLFVEPPARFASVVERLREFTGASCEISVMDAACDLISDAAGRDRPFTAVVFCAANQDAATLDLVPSLREAAQVGGHAAPSLVVLSSQESVARITRADTEGNLDASLIQPVTPAQLCEALHHTRDTTVPTLGNSRLLANSLSGIRLLLVEDNELNRDVARALLSAAGASMAVASNGLEAVAAVEAEARPFHAVLMDMQMPILDGLEATARIRQLGAQGAMPIIAMTANATPEDRARCLAAGMDDHIAKPFDRDVVVEMINAWVRPGQARRRSPEADSPLLDRQEALSRLGGDTAFYDSMLAKLITRLDREVPELVAALTMGDEALTVSVAHSLKGAASTLGAQRLADACARIEMSPSVAGDSANVQAASLLEIAALTRDAAGTD